MKKILLALAALAILVPTALAALNISLVPFGSTITTPEGIVALSLTNPSNSYAGTLDGVPLLAIPQNANPAIVNSVAAPVLPNGSLVYMQGSTYLAAFGTGYTVYVDIPAFTGYTTVVDATNNGQVPAFIYHARTAQWTTVPPNTSQVYFFQ